MPQSHIPQHHFIPINIPHSHPQQHHLIPINIPHSHPPQHHLIPIKIPHSHPPQHHLIPIKIPHSHPQQHHLIPINIPHSHPQQHHLIPIKILHTYRSSFQTSSQTKQNGLDITLTPLPAVIVIGTLSEFCSVSEEAVLSITKKLHQKCCELDPIPTSLVYESTELLLHAITSIISDSFQYDVFPHVFKRELVKPAECVFVVQVLLL